MAVQLALHEGRLIRNMAGQIIASTCSCAPTR